MKFKTMNFLEDHTDRYLYDLKLDILINQISIPLVAHW